MITRLAIIAVLGIIGFTVTAFASHDPAQPLDHSIILPPDMKEKTFEEFMEWCVPIFGDKCVKLEKNRTPKILSPLKQFKLGIPIDEINCREDLVKVIKKSNDIPACIKSESKSKLVQRDWIKFQFSFCGANGFDSKGNLNTDNSTHHWDENECAWEEKPLKIQSSKWGYKSLDFLVEKSDAIITGMVVGEEPLPNDHRNVWLGSYEWLKKGIYDDRQLFLEQSKTNSLEGLDVQFTRGEEVLLFLKDVDVKRGAYDIFSIDGIPAQKYPIELRDAVVSLIKNDSNKIKSKDYSKDKNCSEKFLDNDSYWYCTTKKLSYVPVEILIGEIREKLLENISKEYFEKHFDLVVVYDQPEAVYEPAPNGSTQIIPERAEKQNIEFTFSIDEMDFMYYMKTSYNKETNQIHLQYIPPKEIQSIVSSDAGIDELVYSCLDTGTYKFLYDYPRIAYHVKDGFSPVIEGHGPPTVYDRWGDDAVQDREKIFRIWLALGKADCAKTHHDFEPEYEKRSETTLLIDSVQIQKGE